MSDKALLVDYLKRIVAVLVPILMLSFGSNIFVMIMITIAPLLLGMFNDGFFSFRRQPQLKTMYIKQYNVGTPKYHTQQNNKLFEACTLLYSEKCNNYLTYNMDSTEKFKKGMLEEIICKYIPEVIEPFIYKTDKFEVTINYMKIKDGDEKDTIKTYVITAKTNDDIRSFVDYLKNDVYVRVKEKRIVMAYVYNSQDSYYGNNQDETYNIRGWTPLNINSKKFIDDLLLEESVKNTIRDRCNEIFTEKIEHKAFTKGKPKKNTLLLVGPPGTGKTSVAYAISKTYKVDLFKVDADMLERHIFGINSIPEGVVVLFDEFDTIAAPSTSTDNPDQKVDITSVSIREENKKVANLLSILDSYTNFKNCIVILTANYIEKVDQRLLRGGRVDETIYFEYFRKKQDIINTIKVLCDYNVDPEELPDNLLPIRPSDLINCIIYPNINNPKKIIERIKEDYHPD